MTLTLLILHPLEYKQLLLLLQLAWLLLLKCHDSNHGYYRACCCCHHVDKLIWIQMKTGGWMRHTLSAHTLLPPDCTHQLSLSTCTDEWFIYLCLFSEKQTSCPGGFVSPFFRGKKSYKKCFQQKNKIKWINKSIHYFKPRMELKVHQDASIIVCIVKL